MNAVLIIPSLNPNERLVSLVDDMRCRGLCDIIVVNDGSDAACRPVFDIAGTASPLLIAYLIAAGALLVAGAVIGIRKRAESPRLESSPQSPANG